MSKYNERRFPEFTDNFVIYQVPSKEWVGSVNNLVVYEMLNEINALVYNKLRECATEFQKFPDFVSMDTKFKRYHVNYDNFIDRIGKRLKSETYKSKAKDDPYTFLNMIYNGISYNITSIGFLIGSDVRNRSLSKDQVKACMVSIAKLTAKKMSKMYTLLLDQYQHFDIDRADIDFDKMIEPIIEKWYELHHLLTESLNTIII